ncbi:MAG TPA: protein kinase [Chloroflexia bacterium]|nr:protein kinase [Chloroflexia bacterium]
MIIENTVLNTRYRLEKKIGQGGFAQVFLATDQLLKRRVAVKVLNAELTEDENFLGRFEREAQSIAALEHPNILGVYDYGQAENTAYLVMPFVEGGTLHDKLRKEKKFSPEKAAQYLSQAAAALDYAHRRHIVHRDIKPQNMLLRTEDDRLLLGDFGIAKVLSAASAQSRTGVMGTLSYMAPEQLEGNVGVATDVYALGCVLFQMLTGELPYLGATQEVMMGHLLKPVPSIIERSGGQLPPAVQNVINRALAKKPEERYQSAGELANAFQAAVMGSTNTVVAVPEASAPTELVSFKSFPTEIGGAAATEVVGPNSYIKPVTDPRMSGPQTYGTLQEGPRPVTDPRMTGPQGYGDATRPVTDPRMTQPGVYGQPPVHTPTNPYGYTPSQPYNQPVAAKKGNTAVIAGVGGIIAVAVIAIVLIVVLGGKKDDGPKNVAQVTPSVASTTAAATTAASTTAPVATTAAATPSPTPDAVKTALLDAHNTFYVKGDLQGGINKFRDLSTTYPNRADVWRDYGRALHLWARNAGGVEPLKKAVDLDPKDALAYLYLSSALIDSNNLSDAELAARHAAELDPNGWIGHAAMAGYYVEAIKYDEVKKETDAMQKAANAANLGNDPYYNWLLAINLFYLEDYKGSLDAIDKTLATWPNVPLALSVKASIILYSPSAKADEKANQDKALALLQQALKLSPDSTDIKDTLAEYYVVFPKDLENAQKLAQEVLQVNDQDPNAHYVMGLVQSEKKDYANAFKSFDKCVQINANRLGCQYDWTIALIDQGYDLNAANKPDDAKAAFKEALDKSLKIYQFLPKSAGYNWLVGYAYYNLKDYKNAIPYLQTAVNVLPRADFHAWLGIVYFYDNQKDQAQSEYNKGVAVDPEDPSVKVLGDLLAKK